VDGPPEAGGHGLSGPESDSGPSGGAPRSERREVRGDRSAVGTGGGRVVTSKNIELFTR